MLVPSILALHALSGCAAPSDLEEPTGTTESALIDDGSTARRTAYSCEGGYCTCTGDDDCNDMFSGDDCGPKAICQINPAGIPRCRCSVARAGDARVVQLPGGGLSLDANPSP